jgi:hypothetical protein
MSAPPHNQFKQLIVDGDACITIDEAVGRAATGDLVLFESYSEFASCITLGNFLVHLKELLNPRTSPFCVRWTHVAMVVVLDEDDTILLDNRNSAATDAPSPPPQQPQQKKQLFLDADPNTTRKTDRVRVCLWESVRCAQDDRDLITGIIDKPGPQLVDMRDRLAAHFSADPKEGQVAMRRLAVPSGVRLDSGRLTSYYETNLRTFMWMTNPYRYESNPFVLANSLCKFFWCSSSCACADKDAFETREYFCSELLADTYAAMDSITTDMNACYYTVIDFVEGHDTRITFEEGFSFGRTTEIVPEAIVKDPKAEARERIRTSLKAVGLD